MTILFFDKKHISRKCTAIYRISLSLNLEPNWDVKSIQTLLCNDLQPSLIRMYKAREESVQFFRKVAEDLEVKAVSTKKKTIQVVGRAASIIGKS